MDNKDQKGIFYGYWIVAGCFVLLFLFAGAGFYSFSIFIRPLETQFGWSRSAISFTISIYMLIHGLAGPFVGHLVETHGPKKIMTIFAIIAGATFILVSFTQSLWFFYMSYALLSFGTTGIGFIPVSSVIARWFNKRRGTATGFAMVGLSTGGFVLAPLVGLINAHFDWRIAFVFLGLLVWVLALPVTLFVVKGRPSEIGLLPDGGEIPEISDPDSAVPADLLMEEEGWPFRAAIRTREFFWIAATFFLAPLAQMGMLQHQVPMIIESGISEATAATALGLTAGLGGLGKLSFGRISEIIPFRYASMLCFGLQALGVFALFNAQGMTLIWTYVMIFGFAMGGVIVLLPLSVSHFFGLVSFGVIMGAISMVQAFGTAFGALLSGLIYDYLGSYHYAMITYMILYMTAAAAIFLAGKPRAYGISSQSS